MPVSSTAEQPEALTLGAEGLLAQALASRICHDLVSPVGAVVNGMDLLGDMAGMPATEEIALIAQSARRASTVLAFHRLAFGTASAESAEFARPALAATMQEMLGSARVTLDVLGEDGPALQRPVARMVALAALCARGLLGMGGRVVVRLDPQRPLPIRISAEAVDFERKARFVAMLDSPVAAGAEPDPRTLEYFLIHEMTAAAGARLGLETDGVSVTLTLQDRSDPAPIGN